MTVTVVAAAAAVAVAVAVVVVVVVVVISAVVVVNILFPLASQAAGSAFVYLFNLSLIHNSPDRARGGTHTNQGRTGERLYVGVFRRLSAHLYVYPC